VPSTLPDMTEPGASVSVLPVPPNWIAALLPEIIPALDIEVPPVLARIPYWLPVMLAPALLVTIALV
jgi:hypothetical protein